MHDVTRRKEVELLHMSDPEFSSFVSAPIHSGSDVTKVLKRTAYYSMII